MFHNIPSIIVAFMLCILLFITLFVIYFHW